MDYKKFAELSPCDYAGPLKRESFMDAGIKELWSEIPRIAGPAFTVEMVAGDNLALHRAIYEAPKGSIIVAQTNSMDYAVSGGNVCAIAQNLGIAGFIIDGVVRDIGEVKQIKFPIFGRGVIPMPGIKKAVLPLNTPIVAGGIDVNPGDIIIADEEGVAVIPKDKAEEIYKDAKQRVEEEAAMGLEKWAENHRKKIASFYE
ncbi:RraA family protein [Halarcobacter sp.]|uniref:RraA family protein n=1 Tax=Halarcobacter sp. TaxID=2321133 RepID=UPI0029F5904E|nr:RraA family protein [Halarcobacter sp.]